MTDRSLSSLYRRLAAQSRDGLGDLLDADTLVAAAAGSLRGDRRDEVAMRLARSEVQTDLVRLLRELAPAAQALAGEVSGRNVAAHAREGRGLRHAIRPRRHNGLRWAGLAACLAVTLGAIGLHQQRERAREAEIATKLEAAARPDRIFTSVDRIFSARIDAAQAVGDGLFRSDFNGS
ncbi:MAG TPA: hypothetical protein PKO41_08085 [Dokdonella sp.]|uniref:hypothetical protein n=1 Tax=Dokdonella sp. TaxID=2291710 RepID=UPI0025C4307E|nr:hypothetical protein [Dokdonella sp.]MBX3690711.1 hypothetical protein [Dokdonella sp.]MCW5567917.1 hypothetical protein [Dokdonella sp.]HNR92368.1 hypothetical protein [Dokdonella sp.]